MYSGFLGPDENQVYSDAGPCIGGSEWRKTRRDSKAENQASVYDAVDHLVVTLTNHPSPDLCWLVDDDHHHTLRISVDRSERVNREFYSMQCVYRLNLTSATRIGNGALDVF